MTTLGSSCVDGSVYFPLKYWFSTLNLEKFLLLLDLLRLLVLQFVINLK